MWNVTQALVRGEGNLYHCKLYTCTAIVFMCIHVHVHDYTCICMFINNVDTHVCCTCTHCINIWVILTLEMLPQLHIVSAGFLLLL